MAKWHIEPLSKKHNREDFDCGQPSLNDFLRSHAGQNARSDISRSFVAVSENSTLVAGFYTLSSGSVSFYDLPKQMRRRLPKYPIPTAHLGRLAVDKKAQGQGLGGILLADALKRICKLTEQIGIHAVTVQALDEQAKVFYEKYGFVPLADDCLHLFLPMETIRKL